MSPRIQFKCRGCDAEIATAPAPADQITCPQCARRQEVRISQLLLDTQIVTTCIACGHENLYVQKDFNRRLGLGIVGAGIAASIYFFSQRQPLYAMGALAVMALVDLLAYFLVRDVTVCYACHALYRGFRRNPEHEPFDLKRLEKYGGRSARFGA